jgi:hypothetical protein
MIFGEEYRAWSSLLCSLLHSPVTSSLLGPNILLSTLFSKTLRLHSSLNVSDQLSQPYKTTGKIMCFVIHTLTGNTLGCRMWIECATGIDANAFPLRSITHLKLGLEESINNLQSEMLQCTPNHLISSLMSLPHISGGHATLHLLQWPLFFTSTRSNEFHLLTNTGTMNSELLGDKNMLPDISRFEAGWGLRT